MPFDRGLRLQPPILAGTDRPGLVGFALVVVSVVLIVGMATFVRTVLPSTTMQ